MLKRDVSGATLEDHFDKTILPKVMQVGTWELSSLTLGQLAQLSDQKTPNLHLHTYVIYMVYVLQLSFHFTNVSLAGECDGLVYVRTYTYVTLSFTIKVYYLIGVICSETTAMAIFITTFGTIQCLTLLGLRTHMYVHVHVLVVGCLLGYV